MRVRLNFAVCSFDPAQSFSWCSYAVAPRVFGAERQDCSPETIAQDLREAHGYIGRADYARSERVFSKVLACQKQSLPANHLRIAVTLANLGEAKRLRRQFGPAETLLKEAGRLHEMAGRTEHPAFGSSQLILASVYKDRKQYHLAEPLVRQAMQIFDHSRGPESREGAAALNTLAVLYAESGNLDGARSATSAWLSGGDRTRRPTLQPQMYSTTWVRSSSKWAAQERRRNGFSRLSSCAANCSALVTCQRG